jgi:hypothetical protein
MSIFIMQDFCVLNQIIHKFIFDHCQSGNIGDVTTQINF